MRPSVESHEVAGVHVAVKEPVQDHALEPGAHPDEERRFAVDVGGAQLLDVVDPVTEEALHDEHALRVVSSSTGRGAATCTWPCSTMMRLNSRHVRGLAAEVELLADVRLEVLDDARGVRELAAAASIDITRAIILRTRRSASTTSPIFGRCTLMTTSCPLQELGRVHLRDRR